MNFLNEAIRSKDFTSSQLLITKYLRSKLGNKVYPYPAPEIFTPAGGEHNRHGSVFNTTPAGSQYYQGGFTSKKDALQHLADAHNSNKNR